MTTRLLNSAGRYDRAAIMKDAHQRFRDGRRFGSDGASRNASRRHGRRRGSRAPGGSRSRRPWRRGGDRLSRGSRH